MNETFQSFSTQIETELPAASAFFSGLLESDSTYQPEPFFDQFDQYFTELAMALIDNEFIDLFVAEKICDTLKALLENINDFPHDQQTLIYGAAQYFLESDDAVSDVTSPEGLEDDLVVVNAMLACIGRLDLQISP